MLPDLTESVLGLLICPVVFVLPGYALGQITDVLGFRAHSVAVRLAISLMLAVGIGPIALYGLLHLGWWAAHFFFGGAFVFAAWSLARRRDPIRPLIGPALVAVGIAFTMLLLQIDIGWGDKLYFTTAARDFVRTIAITNEVRAHGVPPLNPMFFEGTGVPLFYYYGWMLMTGAVDVLGGDLVGPRGAVFSATAFCALALIGTVAVYVATSPHPFTGAAERSLKRPVVLAVFLLLVGGLDLLVFLGGAVVLGLTGRPVVITDIEWWNEPFFMWFTSVLTVPHHVAGLIAGFGGFACVRFAVGESGRRRWSAISLSAASFASCVLCSIWIGMAVALVGGFWLILSLSAKNWEECKTWLASGVGALLLLVPFVLYLRSAGTVDGSPLRFGVRPFGPMETFFGFAREGPEMLVHLPFLPLGYAIELGFFALAGFLFWRSRRRVGTPLTQDERLLRLILVVGLVFPTFAFSAVRNNDLGFRVPMLAQFVLLLWSADLLAALHAFVAEPSKRWVRPALRVLILVGVASTVSNIAVTRFATPAADGGLIAMPGMYGTGRDLGERTMAQREGYEWLHSHLPDDAVIQQNPFPGVARREGGYVFAPALYSRRHSRVYDDDMGTMYGVSRAKYDPIAVDIARMFNEPDAAIAAEIVDRFEIDAVIVTDRDPVWRDTTSWVWRRSAAFSNDRVRVFPGSLRPSP